MSVFKDGDDKNFTKAMGASTQSVIKQEATGGDESSSFKTSTMSSSSASKFVTQHKSTTGNFFEYMYTHEHTYTRTQKKQKKTVKQIVHKKTLQIILTIIASSS